MDDLRNKCMPWVSMKVQHKETGQPYMLSILLEDGDIGAPYLCIESTTNEYCLIPINRLIFLSYSFRVLIFNFGDDSWRIIFYIFNEENADTFLSQFHLCASISHIPNDNFTEKNMSFLKSLESDNYSQFSGLLDVYEIPISSFPCVSDPVARNTWNSRCYKINSPYFTDIQEVTMAAMTWNVASKRPTADIEDDLTVILSLGAQLVFLTFEEIDMGAKAIVSGQSGRNEEWDFFISNFLVQSGYDFSILQRSALGGVFSILFVSNSFKDNIQNVSTKTVRFGVHGLTANKGANIFRMEIGTESFTFVGCHLSAGKEALESRIQQLKQIIDLVDTDHLIIEGDLNFRTLLNRDEAEVFALSKQIPQLVKNDQLIKAKADDPIIGRLYEPSILFQPTYKYNIGTDQFDTSQKRAVPSYTDRILAWTKDPYFSAGESGSFVFETDIVQSFLGQTDAFQTAPNFTSQVNPTFPQRPRYDIYQAGQTKISDHRPVRARITFQVPFVNKEKYQRFEETQLKKLDELTRIGQAKLIPSPTDITLIVGQSVSLTMENKSFAWARWKTEIFGESPDAQNAIQMNPNSGIVMPGESYILELTAAQVGSYILSINGESGTYFAIEVNIKPEKKHKKKKIGLMKMFKK